MLNIKTELISRELNHADILSAFSVLSHMYPNMGHDEYESIIKSRLKEGYKMIGVFDEDTLISVAGYWIGVRFYCGKFIQIDNLVTHPDYRNTGTGKTLINFAKELGKKQGCRRIILDSYVENYEAHRFFLREGFIIRGYHLNCDL